MPFHSISDPNPNSDAVANRLRRSQNAEKKNRSNLKPFNSKTNFKKKGGAEQQKPSGQVKNRPNNPLITTTYFHFGPSLKDELSLDLGRSRRDGGTTRNAPCPPPVTAMTTSVDGPSQYCEVCKVYCRNLKILLQHKNGKGHQKNVRAYEKLLQRSTNINEQQSDQIPTSQLNLTDRPKVQESEINGCPIQNMASEDNRKKEIQLENNVENISEVPAEAPDCKTMYNSAARDQRLKGRRQRGEGGNCLRTNDGSKPAEISKPVLWSFYCKTCDVKCDLEIDYRKHLKGKKHINKLKCAQLGHSGVFVSPKAFYGKHLSLNLALKLKNCKLMLPSAFLMDLGTTPTCLESCQITGLPANSALIPLKILPPR
ncbi:hypothetical protein VNO78_25501 [Psophocarpus tetragonolobus]|uniref:U1-type domain-containing protein n=1 Tax=Psophocarpus tetragonolobus TaxID=3891 RepID=A0AAN9S789_PSOTE